MIIIMNIEKTSTNTITIHDTLIQHNTTIINQEGLNITFHVYEDNNLVLNIMETDNDSNFIIEPIIDDPHIEIIEVLDTDGLVQFDIAVHSQAQQDNIIKYLNSITWVNIIANQYVQYKEEE